MGEKIRPDQIKGLKVFDSTSSRLDLCKPHRVRLGEKIATEVNTLIQSPFFREKFSSLYRDVKSGGGEMHIITTAISGR